MSAFIGFRQLCDDFYQESVAFVDAYRQNVFEFGVRVYSEELNHFAVFKTLRLVDTNSKPR